MFSWMNHRFCQKKETQETSKLGMGLSALWVCPHLAILSMKFELLSGRGGPLCPPVVWMDKNNWNIKEYQNDEPR